MNHNNFIIWECKRVSAVLATGMGVLTSGSKKPPLSCSKLSCIKPLGGEANPLGDLYGLREANKFNTYFPVVFHTFITSTWFPQFYILIFR